VLGSKQRAASVETISNNQVRMQWQDLASEHGGILPITLTAVVTLESGVLTFDATLKNDSDLSVETIDYPYFGDLNPPTPDSHMRAEHMWVGNLASSELYPSFGNEKGYWGVRFPTKTIESFQTFFFLLQAEHEGFYVGMHDPAVPYLLEFTFEQHPGVIDSISSRVPRQDEISGLPVHLEFRTCHFVFAHPRSSVQLAPVVVRGYDGDWHAGVDLYKEWRTTWFVPARIPAWSKDVHSWLELQVDGAEQDYSIPYRDVAKYAEECAQNGVTAIQLVGWNHSGQDGHDPSLDTDPGLGTWQELHEAIAQSQARGVKMILFGKPIFSDMSTDLYKNELRKYEATDPYGDKYESGGYSYTTPTQLAGINNRRRAIMDVVSPAYRDIATHEFEKTVSLGAAGWLFDEVMQHNGVMYSFSPDHGYVPPGYLFGADMPLAAQFRAAADKVNPDFIFSGEGPQDWMLQYYPLAYLRINADFRHVSRYIDSHAPAIVKVAGFDDREMLNLILLYRYLISYEPYNFKGHITDFPLTLAYGKKIDALRRKYRAWLWDSEFRDTLGATVGCDGGHRYSVFRTADGKRAVIVVNMESKREITATLSIPNSGNLMAATPEQSDIRPASGSLKIPARSAIVVMEQ
jgi:hypothetical protein